MEEIINTQSAIIRRFSKKIKLIVDEWGTWYDVEEGTNPGFLYQQNTMRDAIVAACNLNIFNNHSDMVCMANLAQAVNVLQALVLTEGAKMVKTPTYHVFDLFKTHQDNELLYSFTENETVNGIPAISQSASVNAEGEITYTLANCSLEDEYEIECSVAGAKLTSAKARILTAEVHALNDFDNAENVKPAEYSAELTENGFKVKLPACSVVTVILS